MPDVREVGEDQLERLLAIHNALRPDDPAAAEEIVDWRRQAEAMAWLLAVEDGADVGAAIVVHGWHAPPGVGRIDLYVRPAASGRGVGSALLARSSSWLRDRGCAEATGTIREDDGASLSWAARRGFVEIGRSSVLVLDLDAVEPPEPAPPDGIRIVAWAEDPGLARGMYGVYCEASPDIPGEEEAEVPGFSDWLANDMHGVSDRPEATFVALAGAEVVAFAKLAIPPVGDVAWHDLTGVRRAWRGRGIAAALKRTQVAWAKANGFRQLKTSNEERNAPIQHLNRKHGYRREPGHVTVRGPLTS